MNENSNEMLRLEKVWRRYRRWKKRPTGIKDTLSGFFHRNGFSFGDFWAIRDVSFSIRRGEIIGICGANGSGKSTLLKLIAKIDPLTYGKIVVYGKVFGLLELTTGFHPNLTGRENIHLNGAILGFDKREVKEKEEDIIRFADLGDFIDSPVNSYSAGMYMRLGFAIATAADADIFLIDEILAVGDAEFQKKCTDWFSNLRAKGATIILVSHDLVTIASVCDRALWIDKGQIVAEGAPERVLKQYSPDLVLP